MGLPWSVVVVVVFVKNAYNINGACLLLHSVKFLYFIYVVVLLILLVSFCFAFSFKCSNEVLGLT